MGFKKGAEDLRECESACHGVECASNAVLWTLEGVGELPSRSSEGFIEGVDKKGKEKGIIEKFPYVMLL